MQLFFILQKHAQRNIISMFRSKEILEDLQVNEIRSNGTTIRTNDTARVAVKSKNLKIQRCIKKFATMKSKLIDERPECKYGQP